ncbi:putative nuclear transport factor 2 [Patellaria atrata CBS 101060]|uniref:Nuclear transport factor 2 n=1 Tax=Patellaria atrata CBS 101060 TaxID=1346257 RepID=A0A9P4SHM3_9PEZI|nr:putative nuclear transport factor 2 [Patellaria atrata CBS 101060]
MADFQEVAKQFTDFYYKQFDSERASLVALYRDHSMLTFENEAFQGTGAILGKLTGLPFAKVVHQIATLDAQPSSEAGGILVLVTGALLVDEEAKPMSYTQTFQLVPADGSYYVLNDIFRLVYAG